MILRFCFIIAVSFAMASCTAKAIVVELPLNHPANPQAPETPFTPPPNPLKSDVSLPVSQGTSPSANHKDHDGSLRHDPDHQKGHRAKSKSEFGLPAPPDSKGQEDMHHQHGGSHQ